MSLSLGYTLQLSRAIVESGGAQPISESPITSHGIAFGTEFVPLDGLGVRVSLPCIGVISDPHAAGNVDFLHGQFDDGALHFSLQDLRLDVRYMFLEDPVAISAMVGGSIPTNDYPRFGSTNIGRRLKQLLFAAAVGANPPFLPELYVHVRYEFALVERFDTDFQEISDVNQNKSDIAAQIGYYILPDLEVNIGVDVRIAHGGFNYKDWNTSGQAFRDFHDAILREGYLLVGGGASYAITDAFSVSALVRVFVTGANTRNGGALGLGLTYQLL